MARARRRKRPVRTLRRAAKRATVRLATWAALPCYFGWMGLVWLTSRRVDHGLAAVADGAQRGRGLVGLLWHEEVFGAPFAYPRLGLCAHVLVSTSPVGDAVSTLLRACGHSVTRGGSSRNVLRSRPLALRTAIRWVRAHPGHVYAALVDGSAGPRYVLKPGSVLLARETGLGVVAFRVWFSRCLRLRTWDRAAVPLPFGEIHTYASGPHEVPTDTDTRKGLAAFRHFLEQELRTLTRRSLKDTGQPIPDELRRPAPPATTPSDSDESPPPTALP